MMHKYSPYIRQFRQFVLESQNIPSLKMVLKKDTRNSYNKPVASEIAALIPSK